MTGHLDHTASHTASHTEREHNMSKTQRHSKTEQDSTQRKPQHSDWLWTASDRRIAAREDDSETMTASDYSAALSRAMGAVS